MMEQPIMDLSETRKKTEERLKKSFQQKQLNAMGNVSPVMASPEGSVERSLERSKDRLDRTQRSGGENSSVHPLSQRTQRVTFKENTNTTFSSAINKSQAGSTFGGGNR